LKNNYLQTLVVAAMNQKIKEATTWITMTLNKNK